MKKQNSIFENSFLKVVLLPRKNRKSNHTGFTLVEIGRGRWTPDDMADIIQAKDRTIAGPTAPAAGLCLMKIDYKDVK